MGMGLVRDPSSWLARAVTGRSHMPGDVCHDMSWCKAHDALASSVHSRKHMSWEHTKR